jgi:hypothetical protein
MVYLSQSPAESPDLVRAAIRGILEGIGISEAETQIAIYRMPRNQGRWRKFSWKLVDEALAAPDVKVLDLLVGNPQDVRFTAKVHLRFDADPRPGLDDPFRIDFACEAATWPQEAIARAGKSLCEAAARLAAPLSGGVFRAPLFIRALGEIDQKASVDGEPDLYPMPLRDWPSERWEKARRLYPITLLGPKLASRVTAAQATAAGALAVQAINGSLLIDAYPTVVETWDPEFLRATVEQRRWLWPLTIQNPADAVGLGFKTRR